MHADLSPYMQRRRSFLIPGRALDGCSVCLIPKCTTRLTVLCELTTKICLQTRWYNNIDSVVIFTVYTTYGCENPPTTSPSWTLPINQLLGLCFKWLFQFLWLRPPDLTIFVKIWLDLSNLNFVPWFQSEFCQRLSTTSNWFTLFIESHSLWDLGIYILINRHWFTTSNM